MSITLQSIILFVYLFIHLFESSLLNRLLDSIAIENYFCFMRSFLHIIGVRIDFICYLIY